MRPLTACARLYADQPLKAPLSAPSLPSSFTALCPLSKPGHLWKLMISVSTSSSSTPGFFIITLIWFLPFQMQTWTVEKLMNESEIRLNRQDFPHWYYCYWSVITLRAYSCQSSSLWTQSTLIKRTEGWRNVREWKKRMSEGRRAEGNRTVAYSDKRLSVGTITEVSVLFFAFSLTLFFSFMHYSSIHLAFHFLSLSLSWFFFFSISLSRDYHTLCSYYLANLISLYQSIWGMMVLGHSWHNPLLPPYIRYTRHCAEWMRRASQCTRTRALTVPGTASKSMRPHNIPPPVICH